MVKSKLVGLLLETWKDMDRVVDVARALKPSERNELEITDLNLEYMRSDDLHVEILGRGTAWLDTGTYESLLQAANFIQAIQERQGLKVACIEEIAYRKGYIGKTELSALAKEMSKNAYGEYLLRLAEDDA